MGGCVGVCLSIFLLFDQGTKQTDTVSTCAVLIQFPQHVFLMPILFLLGAVLTILCSLLVMLSGLVNKFLTCNQSEGQSQGYGQGHTQGHGIRTECTCTGTGQVCCNYHDFLVVKSNE